MRADPSGPLTGYDSTTKKFSSSRLMHQKQGDPIHLFRTGSTTIHDGAILVRKNGHSDRATSADHDRLTLRAVRPVIAAGLSVGVTIVYSGQLSPLALDQDRANAFVTRERERLMAPVKATEARRGCSPSGEKSRSNRS